VTNCTYWWSYTRNSRTKRKPA